MNTTDKIKGDFMCKV